MSFDTYFDYLYHIVMASPNKRKPTFTNFGSPKKGKKPDESKPSSVDRPVPTNRPSTVTRTSSNFVWFGPLPQPRMAAPRQDY